MLNKIIPKISIIIPVFNNAQYLAEAIESITSQTFTDWEIIATDDGSTDQSHQILESYSKKINLKIITQENQGLSSARNAAIRASSGEYITFLDADDKFMPEKLERQYATFFENPAQVMSYTQVYHLKGNKLIPFRQKPHHGMIFNELFYSNNFIPVMTVMLRKDIVTKYGLFDTSLKVAQDYDLWLKIAENHEIFCLDEPLTIYRIHDNNTSKNVELMMKEEVCVMEKWVNKYPHLAFSAKYNMKKMQIKYNLFRYHAKIGEYRKVFEDLKKLTI